jgi:rhodanese-related sulfurtransferase
MAEPTRVSPKEAREKTTSGSAILVCAYDREDKFKANHLEGAISMSDFREKLPSLPKDKEIIFYCA